MEALYDNEALQPPSASEMPKEEPPEVPEQTQTAGQSDFEEPLIKLNSTPATSKATASKPDPPLIQTEGDLLDEVADMNIPKTINMEQSFQDDNRANQVVSPDGSTFDGTSTIGSAASEPTTETGVSRGTRSQKKTASGVSTSGRSSGGRSVNSRGGNSRNSRNSRGGNSRNGGTRTSASPNASAQQPARRSYRNSYSGTTRMNNSTVPRPFKRPGPLSYSKAVRLSGTGSPFAGREVDDKTRAVLADINEFDSAQMETQ